MARTTTWVTGHHAVAAVLRLSPQRVISMWVVINHKNAIQTDLLDQAERIGVPIQFADKRELAKRCGSDQHQGIALEATPKKEGSDPELQAHIEDVFKCKTPLLLVLDQVQDPHNFGACLRTADAAGADAVIVAKDNACPITPVVQKVASGAVETMPIFRVTNLARSLDSIKEKGLWVIGTSDKASHSIFEETLTAPLAIVMGAEGKGMRKLTEKKCDTLVSLPMAGAVVSSLNVSVATGICLYEVVRQRKAPPN